VPEYSALGAGTAIFVADHGGWRLTNPSTGQWPSYADGESALGYGGLDAIASFVTGLAKYPFDAAVTHLAGGLSHWIGRTPTGLTVVKFTTPVLDFSWHLALEIADNTLKDVFVEPALGRDIPAIAEP